MPLRRQSPREKRVGGTPEMACDDCDAMLTATYEVTT